MAIDGKASDQSDEGESKEHGGEQAEDDICLMAGGPALQTMQARVLALVLAVGCAIVAQERRPLTGVAVV